MQAGDCSYNTCIPYIPVDQSNFQRTLFVSISKLDESPIRLNASHSVKQPWRVPIYETIGSIFGGGHHFGSGRSAPARL
jgi:hypothetical protein